MAVLCVMLIVTCVGRKLSYTRATASLLVKPKSLNRVNSGEKAMREREERGVIGETEQNSASTGSAAALDVQEFEERKMYPTDPTRIPLTANKWVNAEK